MKDNDHMPTIPNMTVQELTDFIHQQYDDAALKRDQLLAQYDQLEAGLNEAIKRACTLGKPAGNVNAALREALSKAKVSKGHVIVSDGDMEASEAAAIKAGMAYSGGDEIAFGGSRQANPAT